MLEAIMRVSVKSVLAAGGAILAASALTPALAGEGQVRVLMVPLPGGVIEQIQYTGDVAPRIVLVPSAMVAVPVMSFDPFAALQRISAMMDQQAAAMLRPVDAMPRMMTPNFPQGASGYSFVSTMSGNGVCTRSVRITYSSGDAAPKMVSSSSGDCRPEQGGPPPAEIDQPASAPRPAIPHTIEVKATGPTQVALNR
jgi:hypothetical protein